MSYHDVVDAEGEWSYPPLMKRLLEMEFRLHWNGLRKIRLPLSG